MRALRQQPCRAKPAQPGRLAMAVTRRPLHGTRLNAVVAPSGPETAPQPAAGAPATTPVGYRNAVMLQVFGWDTSKVHEGKWYDILLSQAAGVTHVWLPPPSQSVSAEGYLPGQLYNLTSKYGNKEQLVALNKALRDAGIKPMADIVINHRCADEKGPDGKYNKYRDDVDHLGNKIDWGTWAITSNDPEFGGTGNPDTGDDYGAAPDLDHANPELRKALTQWLAWLKNDIGFVSWRLDFARGYAAKYIKEYIDATSTAAELNVAEYWVDAKWNGSELDYNQDASRQKLCDFVNATGKTCTAFDFTLKGILNETMKHTQYCRLKDAKGKAPGMNGWWPSKAVTFVGNHDTDSTAQHWPFPPDGMEAGYAYILTHPGMPCVFYDHLFKWGEPLRKAITTLIALRSRNGILADSKLEILVAESDLYVARIGERITVKLGPRYDMGKLVPKEEEGWAFSASGKDWAVWEKKGAGGLPVCDAEPEIPYEPGKSNGSGEHDHDHDNRRHKHPRIRLGQHRIHKH